MYDFIKNVPLFKNMPEEDLQRLCEMMEPIDLEDGEVLFNEGEAGDRAYLLKSGDLEILKVSGNRQVLLAVRGPGELIGELALLEEKPRMATVRARGDVELLTVSKEQLDHLLSISSSAAQAMFYVILDRWRGTESRVQQSEKMVQLGKLTAGIAHELNNPAAAVRRGAEQLEGAMNDLSHAYVHLSESALSEEQWKHLDSLSHFAQEQAARPPQLDALARSDQEEELEEWLEDHYIDEPWELAATLVDLSLPEETMEELAQNYKGQQLEEVLSWLNSVYTVHSLFAELKQGATRIAGIVTALKTYSYLDQAPVQAVDVNKGLDDSLLIMSHKLKNGISVRREYAEDLPQIQGYGVELNQVWTNMIDNAADALLDTNPPDPTIVLRTRSEDDNVIVEIEDNGPGIPEDVQKKIFDPFFTTKPPGVGTGLGMDISYNIIVHKHRGQISIDTEPGRTTFVVSLPVDFDNCDVAPTHTADHKTLIQQEI